MEQQRTEVRIVAGTLRGRKISCVVHDGLRPTPQFVREALFSILGNAVPNRIFYDIFAGTGVFGIEAISRGASSSRLIEKDPKLVTEINKYADRFGITDKIQVLRADAYRWAERWVPPMVIGEQKSKPVNLFLSPPFPDLDPARIDEFLGLVRLLYEKAPDESVLTVQVEDGFPIDLVDQPELWDIRKYGRNLLMFRVKGEENAPKPAEQ